MVTEFCGFGKGVVGKKLPSDTTLNNMKKADLIKLLHTAQHNYETLMWFYNNAVNANMAQLNNNGWIPCSERLPEDETKRYIVQETNGFIDILGFTKDAFKQSKFDFYEYKGKKKALFYEWDSEYGYIERECEAWMPLPEHYEEPFHESVQKEGE